MLYFLFRGRKPKKSVTMMSFDDLVSDTEPMDELSSSIQIPRTADQHHQSMQTTTDYSYMQYNYSNNAYYQYNNHTCYRCDQLLLENVFYSKCNRCMRMCCLPCAQLYYNTSSTYFICENCSLNTCLTTTLWL